MSEVITEGTFFNGVIADIAEINPRTDIALAEEERVSFLPMQNTSESGDIIALQERVFAQVSKGYTRFAENDVLVAKITPCFENGKGGYAKGLLNGIGFGSTEFHIVRAIPGKADSRFLHHLTRSERFRKAGEGSMTGSAGQKRIPSNFIKDFPIFIPPLPEQKKIAEILSGIDKSIDNLRSKALQITSCKHSVLSDFLTGRGRNTRQLEDGEWTTGVIDQMDLIPCEWEIVNINDVAQLESGHTPSRRCPEYWGGRIPWISLADSKRLDQDHEITETSNNTNNEGIANSSARLLPKGTVCLSRTASIGKCIIMGEEMATSQDFANFICGPRLHNHYLLFLFRYMQETWKMLSGGSTHQTIYMPIFKSLQIPLPNLSEQKHIANLMRSFDRTNTVTLARIDKFIAIKKSLSIDLLSGRKRVSDTRVLEGVGI
jgi:type I restriction enzyme, S subunit